MKAISYCLTALCLGAFSMSAFADKVTIKGEPVVIEKRGDVYYVPDTYKSPGNYYYVTMDGAKRVCYLEKQPSLRLDAMSVNVMVGGEKRTWNCYTYDDTYFVVEP